MSFSAKSGVEFTYLRLKIRSYFDETDRLLELNSTNLNLAPQDVRTRDVDMDVVQQMAVHFGVSLSDMHPLVVNVSTYIGNLSKFKTVSLS